MVDRNSYSRHPVSRKNSLGLHVFTGGSSSEPSYMAVLELGKILNNTHRVILYEARYHYHLTQTLPV